MNNNINNKINFTAKLNVRALTGNKARWQKIAQEFERQTLKLKDDTLVLSNDDELVIAKHYGPKVTTEDSRINLLSLTKDGTEKLMKLSDNKIAKKFVELLKIFKKEQHTDNVHYALRNTIIPTKKNENLNIDTELVHNTLDALKVKIKKDTSDSFAKDNILNEGIKDYWSYFAQ